MNDKKNTDASGPAGLEDRIGLGIENAALMNIRVQFTDAALQPVFNDGVTAFHQYLDSIVTELSEDLALYKSVLKTYERLQTSAADMQPADAGLAAQMRALYGKVYFKKDRFENKQSGRAPETLDDFIVEVARGEDFYHRVINADPETLRTLDARFKFSGMSGRRFSPETAQINRDFLLERMSARHAEIEERLISPYFDKIRTDVSAQEKEVFSLIDRMEQLGPFDLMKKYNDVYFAHERCMKKNPADMNHFMLYTLKGFKERILDRERVELLGGALNILQEMQNNKDTRQYAELLKRKIKQEQEIIFVKKYFTDATRMAVFSQEFSQRMVPPKPVPG